MSNITYNSRDRACSCAQIDENDPRLAQFPPEQRRMLLAQLKAVRMRAYACVRTRFNVVWHTCEG